MGQPENTGAYDKNLLSHDHILKGKTPAGASLLAMWCHGLIAGSPS